MCDTDVDFSSDVFFHLCGAPEKKKKKKKKNQTHALILKTAHRTLCALLAVVGSDFPLPLHFSPSHHHSQETDPASQ